MKKDYRQRIRDLREDHDFKQWQVAPYLKITRQVYSRYETGINEMPIRHLIVLSNFYHVSCDYILGLTDDPRRLGFKNQK